MQAGLAGNTLPFFFQSVENSWPSQRDHPNYHLST